MPTIGATGRDTHYYDGGIDTLVPVVAPGMDGAPGRDFIAVYPSIAARDAAPVPPEGSLCVTLDYDALWMRGATKWYCLEADTLTQMQTTTQTPALTGQWVTVAWNTIVRNPIGLWKGGGFGVTIPPGFAGTWLFQATIDFVGNTTGRRGLCLTLNNSERRGVVVGSTLTTTHAPTLTACAIIDMDEGDFVDPRAFQDTGANLMCGTATAGVVSNSLYSARLLGPSGAMS